MTYVIIAISVMLGCVVFKMMQLINQVDRLTRIVQEIIKQPGPDGNRDDSN